MKSEELICTKRQLEAIIYEQSVRNQAQYLARLYQRVSMEEENLAHMEKHLQKMREAL